MMAVEEEHLHKFELLLPSSHQFFFTTPAGSELSSPIGSDELSSSSTESSQEEEDYIGELTRQMAQSMLHDEDKLEKPWGLSGSPESTLWSQFGSSNHDSPIGPSREPSPPLIPMVENFEKMKVNEETDERYNNQGERFSNTFNSVQVSGGGDMNARFQSKQALIDEQIRAIQFYRLKHEQSMKQMEQKPRSKHSNQSKGCPWYKLQQQQQRPSNQPAGSQMRAVFLNPPGSKNGSCGTGVFLPRGIGETPTESRKKQGSKKGCATVLIPARVVQALKLHFEKTGVPIPPTRSNDCAFPLQHAACVSGRNNNNNMSSWQNQSKPVVVPAQEMSLPQEWTY